jgi:hypothetical protein
LKLFSQSEAKKYQILSNSKKIAEFWRFLLCFLRSIFSLKFCMQKDSGQFAKIRLFDQNLHEIRRFFLLFMAE